MGAHCLAHGEQPVLVGLPLRGPDGLRPHARRHRRRGLGLRAGLEAHNHVPVARHVHGRVLTGARRGGPQLATSHRARGAAHRGHLGHLQPLGPPPVVLAVPRLPRVFRGRAGIGPVPPTTRPGTAGAGAGGRPDRDGVAVQPHRLPALWQQDRAEGQTRVELARCVAARRGENRRRWHPIWRTRYQLHSGLLDGRRGRGVPAVAVADPATPTGAARVRADRHGGNAARNHQHRPGHAVPATCAGRSVGGH